MIVRTKEGLFKLHEIVIVPNEGGKFSIIGLKPSQKTIRLAENFKSYQEASTLLTKKWVKGIERSGVFFLDFRDEDVVQIELERAYI